VNEKRIGIIGLGNVLMGDDGFGPFVVHLLESGYSFPDNVVVSDLGTPSLDLAGYIQAFDSMIVIDAATASGTPGELRTYDRKDIVASPLEPRITPHEPTLKEALLTAEFEGSGPKELTLVGVVPQRLGNGIGLSPPVRAAASRAVAMIVAELMRLGVDVQRRPGLAAKPAWWERETVRE